MTVTVYTTRNCGSCVVTKRALEGAGIEYESVDLASNPEAFAMVTGLGYKSAPVVVTGSGEHWSGFQPERISDLVAA